MDSIYEYGRYKLVVIDDHYEGDVKTKGYGVVNKETGVTELSTTLLAQAIVWTRNCEQRLAEVENEQAEPNAWLQAIKADYKSN